MAVLYTAKEVNVGIRERFSADLQALVDKGVTPTLATVRVGENGADVSYEIGATKRMNALGLGVRNVVLAADAPQDEIITAITELGADAGVHGILLFQPLPEGIDDAKVKAAIPPLKDVDCATVDNLGAVLAGRADCYPYCAPAAVMELLDHYGIALKGKNVAIVGSGLVVGRPLAMLMASRLATVSICNVFTQDVPSFTKNADIVVAATGVAGLITGKYVREGQIVIDVGTTYRDGKLYGDVNMDSVEPVVAAVTPTPGGVSGITTTVLAKHVIQAAKSLTAN